MWLRRIGAWSVIVFVASAPAGGAERYLDFVKGLRDRGYHDYALLYLDSLEKRSAVPPEVKETIPFEKGLILLDSARLERNPEVQARQFDQARSYLEQFLKERPNHLKAGQANAELAAVYLAKGRVEVQQARSPANLARKSELQKRARAYFADARKVLEPARDRYKAEYEKHEKFIPQTDKARYEARERPYLNYLQAQLSLAELLYDEAQSYDKGSSENRKLLTQAANAFEQIHVHYRSQHVGLIAHMLQAKCFQEQDDPTKALGIYNELLGHGGGNPGPTLKSLQDRVLGYKLICLNHEKQKGQDHQVAIQLAAEWIKANRELLSSRDGLAIQWEFVRAQEAKAKGEGTSAAEKTRLLQQALTTARSVNRFAGEFKDVSNAAIQRLLVALDREPGDPKDFASAFSTARNLIDDIRNRNQQIEALGGAERERLAGELQPVLKEAARILNIGLSLASPKDDDKDVNRARYFLAYVYYNLRDYGYDAAILAEHVARKYRAEQPDLAAETAYLAMAAYMQAFHRTASRRTPESQEAAADLRRIGAACEFITENFPQSGEAQDARISLGSLYSQMRQPAQAATWYLQVPESAPQFLEAQLAAGSAFWIAYLDGSIRPEGDRPAQADLDELARQAREILQSAIARFERQLPRSIDQVEPQQLDSLTRAKYTYSHILNLTGDYKAALALLAEGPLSVLAAVAPPDGDDSQRPPKGNIKSQEFAGLAHQQVLRAAVGLQDLDRARAEMKELEKLEGSGGGGAAVTRIYLELGKELQKEVERLQAARDPRLKDVLTSFEKFLDDMSRRQDGQDYNSLMWVAETYRALGDGLEEGDSANAAGYYSKALGALQMILDEERRNPEYAPAGTINRVKLRKAVCLRRQRSFDEAEKLIVGILHERSQALDAQIEAAQLYEDRAAHADAGDRSLWAKAIAGDQFSKRKDRGKLIWGWQGIAQRLESNLTLSSEPNPEFEEQYLNARYHVAWCRYQAALARTSRKERSDLFEQASTDVRVTALVSPSLGGGASWKKFNTLYRDVQQSLIDAGMQKQPIADLERGARRSPGERPVASGKKPAGGKKPSVNRKSRPVKVREKPANAAAAGGAMLWIAGGVAGLAGAAAWLMLRNRRSPLPARHFPEYEPIELSALDKPGGRSR